MTKRSCLLITVVGSILAGCGGSDSDSSAGSGTTFSPTYSAGESGNSTVASLTPSQRRAFCAEIIVYERNEFKCKTRALWDASTETTDAEARTQCQQGYDECQADTSSADSQSDTQSEIDDCTTSMETCGATMAAAASCVNDLASTGRAWLDQFPACNSISLTQLANLASPPNPASCTLMRAMCPE